MLVPYPRIRHVPFRDFEQFLQFGSREGPPLERRIEHVSRTEILKEVPARAGDGASDFLNIGRVVFALRDRRAKFVVDAGIDNDSRGFGRFFKRSAGSA